MLFPPGMSGVATLTWGKTARLAFMHPMAWVMFWVAVGAWALAATPFLGRLAGHPHGRALSVDHLQVRRRRPPEPPRRSQ